MNEKIKENKTQLKLGLTSTKIVDGRRSMSNSKISMNRVHLNDEIYRLLFGLV